VSRDFFADRGPDLSQAAGSARRRSGAGRAGLERTSLTRPRIRRQVSGLSIMSRRIGAAIREVPVERVRKERGMPKASMSGRVLIVEDTLIIAFDAAEMLREIGARDVLTVGSVSEAMAALAGEPFTFALVDFDLAGETCLPVVQLLTNQRVPFVITTGHDPDDVVLGDGFSPPDVLVKPYSERDLFAAAGQAVARLRTAASSSD